MNAESFAALLKEYAHLYQLPMEQLRTLAMQYPYCHNLQVLLQEKAELDQHPDREKTLSKAATYAIDRKHLYKRLKLMREKRTAPKAEAYHLGEDFLELKDLSSVQADLEKIALGTYEDPTTSHSMAIEPEPPSGTDLPGSSVPSLNSSWNGSWDGHSEDDMEDLQTGTLDFSLNSITTPQDAVVEALETVQEGPEEEHPMSAEETPAPLPDSTPSIPVATGPTPIAPTPKKAFSSWNSTAQNGYLQTSIQKLLENQQIDAKKTKHLDGVDSKNEVNKKAWQSIVDGDSMASETWAQLLVAQKQYHKAIEVYERLILLIPEKSSFFASQIESIKKSLT